MKLAGSQESVEPLKPSEEDSGLEERQGGVNDEQCPKLLKGQVKVFPLSHGEEVALRPGHPHRAAVEKRSSGYRAVSSILKGKASSSISSGFSRRREMTRGRG